MKHSFVPRASVIALLAIFSSMFAYGARTSVQRGRGNDGETDKAVNSPVVIKMQKHSVPRPNVIRNRNHVVRDNNRARWPERDESGAQIAQQPSVTPPRNHVSIVRDRSIVRNIQRERRVEVVPNRYYWHNVNGMRYAHYYDHHRHWYGFYHGPTFYWTYLNGNRWWWYDAHFDRWTYYWEGYWWWPSPSGAVYVYVDNNYYPYNEAGVMVKKPEVESPPSAVPSANEGATWKSPDNQRMVQVFGAQSDAFLYDISSGKPAFKKYLGQGVDKVRFSGGTYGKPLQILLDYKEGTFALFTSDGNPLDMDSAPSAPPSSAPPPISPSEIPPPPAGNQ